MHFKTLFGLDTDQIQKTCVLLPHLPKGILNYLKVPQLSRGKIYASGNNKHFSIIHTKIGAPLCGDAVLYLKATRCENIIFLGTCGIIKETNYLDIGTIVCMESCLEMESFSQALAGINNVENYSYPEEGLLQNFLEYTKDVGVCRTKGVSFGSLKLEEKYIDYLTEKGIDVVDMECSALFAAAQNIKRKAFAVTVCTDIIGKKPFYRTYSTDDQHSVNGAVKQASEIIYQFVSGL